MKLKYTFLLIVCISLISCGTVPKSRGHFIELVKEETGFGPFKRMAFSKRVSRPFDQVFNNIKDKLEGCIPGGYQTMSMRGSSMSSLSVTNNNRIEKVSKNKAEITMQQKHSSTAMQSTGGFYLLAADIHRIDSKSVRIDFFTGKHYLSIAEAIEQWAKGSNKCHGIGGNP